MHFSKTYTQLLLNLPPELRDNAVQYRQLKKLINQVVLELTTLGLSPEILHKLLVEGSDGTDGRVVYEFLSDGEDDIEPRLRFYVKGDNELDTTRIVDVSEETSLTDTESGNLLSPQHPKSLLWALQKRSLPSGSEYSRNGPHEIIIPLPSDSAFFHLLSTALHGVSSQLVSVRDDFIDTLNGLSRDISASARPVSEASSGFRPYSVLTTHPGNLRVSKSFDSDKSDLYTWRTIFQLYIESEVFASPHEMDRGERTVEEAEKRLKSFVERVTIRGLELKMRRSKQALERFLELNLAVLNVKKFQEANAEATRKILKKHAKRTALPLPPPSTTTHALIITLPTSLPLILVQSISEILLPVIPALEDYACLICADIAFKPIRLTCTHLFCVRCLVKMQKRGQGDCPMCRAGTVSAADRSNVDWGLLNFMQDWFPLEAREKLQQNEREAEEEQLRELGLEIGMIGQGGEGCCVM